LKEPVKARRPYRSAVREERARANRLAILAAARRRFLADCYARTTITAVASEAGVSEDLVYVLFTTRRGLFTAILSAAIRGEDADAPVLEQTAPQAIRDEPDQHRQVRLFVADHAQRIDRARPLDDMMRSAAAIDPDIATHYRSAQANLFHHLEQFVTAVAANSPLRDHQTTQEAAADVAALCGPDTHRMLVDELHFDPDAYSNWLNRTIATVLLR